MSRGADGRVRLGVVGLGTVAQAVHLPLLGRHRDRFVVAAVCDLSAGLTAAVAGRFGLDGAARCRSVAELLDGGLVDAVLVLTSGSHGAVAAAALERGLAVFCEKPLAYTLAEADELARVAGRTGALLQLGYMKLYDPAVRRAARELAGSGQRPRAVEVTVLHPSAASQLAQVDLAAPGDVAVAEAAALREETDRLRVQALGPAACGQPGAPTSSIGYAPPPGDPARDRGVPGRPSTRDPARDPVAAWRPSTRDPARDPGVMGRLYTEVLLGSLVHDLAVVRVLAGGLERVDHVDVWPDGTWESVAVDAAGPGGVRISLRWHYLDRYPTYREEVRVHHEHGSVELAFPSPYLLHAPTVLTVTDRDGDAVRVRTDRSAAEAFEQELLAFHRLVAGGRPPEAGIAEGRADILTCQRIVRRLAAGCGIELAGEAARA
jgi:myo-inositol 2-dehydrogenase/D-chiro-inositol 1-dehydrogenase